MNLRRSRGLGAVGRDADAFTLVTLVIFVTVLNVMVAVALPVWTQQIRREKEEELIFRGLQYAEAIRLFQTRAGRYPVRLEELLEVQPRSIRQLWKDPMTEDGSWNLILAQGSGQPGRPGEPDQGRIVGGTPGASQDLGASRRRRTRRERETVTVGPIVGVHSKSEEKSIKSFLGGETYNAWLFTPDLLPIAPTAPGEIIPSLNSKWVGRPFPEGVEPAEGTGIDDEFDEDEGEDEEDATTDRRRKRDRKNRRRGDG